jgi:hypothetical protein
LIIHIIELRRKFIRGNEGCRYEKKMRILKKFTELIVFVFDESVGIDAEEDEESDKKGVMKVI